MGDVVEIAKKRRKTTALVAAALMLGRLGSWLVPTANCTRLIAAGADLTVQPSATEVGDDDSDGESPTLLRITAGARALRRCTQHSSRRTSYSSRSRDVWRCSDCKSVASKQLSKVTGRTHGDECSYACCRRDATHIIIFRLVIPCESRLCPGRGYRGREWYGG